MMARKNQRLDHGPGHRAAFEKNKRKILLTQTVCGICGKIVERQYRYPHPMSATIDHIIPLAKGGHPSDLDNLQLAHFACNRRKYDSLVMRTNDEAPQTVSNTDLPWSTNWLEYRSK